jgi:hypothetical protein
MQYFQSYHANCIMISNIVIDLLDKKAFKDIVDTAKIQILQGLLSKIDRICPLSTRTREWLYKIQNI